MRKYQSMVLPLLAWVLLLTVAACDKDDEEMMGKIAPSAYGIFVDERDGHEYRWVRYGSLDWMADNFSYDLKNEQRCLVYLNAEDYDYTICPEHWRLVPRGGACLPMPTGRTWSAVWVCLPMRLQRWTGAETLRIACFRWKMIRAT